MRMNFTEGLLKMSGYIKRLVFSFTLSLPVLFVFASATSAQKALAKQPAVVASAEVQASPCANGRESGLPLPSTFLRSSQPVTVR
jgi:hypothetical protein